MSVIDPPVGERRDGERDALLPDEFLQLDGRAVDDPGDVTVGDLLDAYPEVLGYRAFAEGVADEEG